MSQSQRNPFIYGRPVPTGRFIGRLPEVRTLFSRLANGESTAVVGEPHIGKSSLLAFLSDANTQHAWISDIVDRQLFAEIDCHLIAANFTIPQFWQMIFDQMLTGVEDAALREQCAVVAQNQFGSLALERLFKLLAKREKRLVLLIDEFDALLNHPNFGTPEFLGSLRSFATRTDGLVAIIASRLSVAQMNRMSMRQNPYGSPFFNNMTEVRLPHLSAADADVLLDRTLSTTGSKMVFDSGDRLFLFGLAGHHPYLLQVAAASLFDAVADGTPGADGTYQRAEKLFRERAAAHFEDLTRTLEANTNDPIRGEDQIDRAALREQLVNAFDKDELRELCFNLGVDYEELDFSGKGALAVRMILFCQRKGVLGRLRELCRAQRPDRAW